MYILKTLGLTTDPDRLFDLSLKPRNQLDVSFIFGATTAWLVFGLGINLL
jgi:hypothetical protein